MDSFTKKWAAMGLNDDDLIVLQELLLKDPKIGDVIPGASGIRKIRIPLDGIGKRSGGRVIYIDIEVKECIYLFMRSNEPSASLLAFDLYLVTVLYTHRELLHSFMTR